MTYTVAYRQVRSRRKFLEMPKAKVQVGDFLDSDIKPELIKRFERVTSNWDHKVDFKARKFVNTKRVMIRVFPAGKNKKIWIFVSGGTRPHKIRPRKAKRLAFVSGGPGSYKPKTKAVGKFGGPGVVVGGSPVFAKEVNHPGNEGRGFEKTIAEDYKPEYARVMENAFRRIIRRL